MLALPLIRQKRDYDCGAAAVAVVLRFFGRPGKVDAIASRLNSSGIDGTDPRTIEALLRAEELCVASGAMTLADLRHHTRQGRPVICSVTMDGGHYVVCGGVSRRHVHFLDPAHGERKISLPLFLTAWSDFDRFGVRYHQFGIAAWL